MKDLTISNVPDVLFAALEGESVRRGMSLDQVVIELLCRGIGAGTPWSNGLGRLAGGWTEEEFREFEEALAGEEIENSAARSRLVSLRGKIPQASAPRRR